MYRSRGMPPEEEAAADGGLPDEQPGNPARPARPAAPRVVRASRWRLVSMLRLISPSGVVSRQYSTSGAGPSRPAGGGPSGSRAGHHVHARAAPWWRACLIGQAKGWGFPCFPLSATISHPTEALI